MTATAAAFLGTLVGNHVRVTPHEGLSTVGKLLRVEIDADGDLVLVLTPGDRSERLVPWGDVARVKPLEKGDVT